MSNLNSFAELIRKGKEDKRLKDLQEQERKKAEFSPLLGDLFKTVSKAKIVEQKRQNVVSKVDELEAKIVTQDEVTELVSEKLDQLADTSEKKLVQIVKNFKMILLISRNKFRLNLLQTFLLDPDLAKLEYFGWTM